MQSSNRHHLDHHRRNRRKEKRPIQGLPQEHQNRLLRLPGPKGAYGCNPPHLRSAEHGSGPPPVHVPPVHGDLRFLLVRFE